MIDPLSLLRRLFDEAVRAASDFSGLGRDLPPVKGRVAVVGAGKAAFAMGLALEEGLPTWLDPARLTGFVVQPDEACPALRHLDVLTAGHPVPDARSVEAGERALALAASLGPDDLLVGLISGGGSALLAAPRDGISLEQKIEATRAMLRQGRPIAEINAERVRMSRIKGGGLARAAWPAAVATFVVSDIPGDDLWRVASGPTLTDAPFEGGLPPVLLASSDTALRAARHEAERMGWRVMSLGGAVEGSAVGLAQDHLRIIDQVAGGDRPALILSGGEATVTVNGGGRGGRNAEFCLALAIALDGRPGVFALAADTDGVDGCGPEAGAMIDPTTLARARALGLDPSGALANNDSLTLFARLGDTVSTGHTRTNVNDFRAVLVLPDAA